MRRQGVKTGKKSSKKNNLILRHCKLQYSRQHNFGKMIDTEISVKEYTQETDRDVNVMQWKENSLFNR